MRALQFAYTAAVCCALFIMVVRRAIHHMRQRPDEDKHAVASSVAFAVVGILLLAWGGMFFRNVQSASSTPVSTAPVSEQVLDALRVPTSASAPIPSQASALPNTYLPSTAATSTDDLNSGGGDVTPTTSVQQNAYDDSLKAEEEAAMRALRGDILVPPTPTTTVH